MFQFKMLHAVQLVNWLNYGISVLALNLVVLIALALSTGCHYIGMTSLGCHGLEETVIANRIQLWLAAVWNNTINVESPWRAGYRRFV